MKYSKLVRDKIPEIIKSKGMIPIVHIADEEEYWQKLKEKLQEEVNEFFKKENEEELADILEVIYAICEFKNFDKEKLELLRRKKAEEGGGFQDKIILDETKQLAGS
jgi:predicted house-cleaning noncanonical NTP pyrophosphatase (MazG superfamily)